MSLSISTTGRLLKGAVLAGAVTVSLGAATIASTAPAQAYYGYHHGFAHRHFGGFHPGFRHYADGYHPFVRRHFGGFRPGFRHYAGGYRPFVRHHYGFRPAYFAAGPAYGYGFHHVHRGWGQAYGWHHRCI